MTKCPHNHTKVIDERCYSGPVACPPYTYENLMAHGNIEITERCMLCGKERKCNVNGRHVEVGTWG